MGIFSSYPKLAPLFVSGDDYFPNKQNAEKYHTGSQVCIPHRKPTDLVHFSNKT